ncbi:MAG TPA: hypothetical protein VFF37_01545, partial [Streptomyces sp.]|nr:hypothetical protein [Streptomyces sp.]
MRLAGPPGQRRAQRPAGHRLHPHRARPPGRRRRPGCGRGGSRRPAARRRPAAPTPPGGRMSVLSTVATLTASRTGRAEPLTTVRHQHLDEKPFVLVPLTLAGEACAPLAALAGTDP